MLFLFWVIHFPPTKYEEAILYPVTQKRNITDKQAVRSKRKRRRDAARVRLPDRHVLVDVVDVSEHDFPRQHREGEGACGGVRYILCYTDINV